MKTFLTFILGTQMLFAIVPAFLEDEMEETEVTETVVIQEKPIAKPKKRIEPAFDWRAEYAKLMASKKPTYNDDIDQLLKKIPQKPIDRSKWLVVIGIEKYSETDNIKFAKRSAESFKKVAQKVLGIDNRRTILLINQGATSGRIKDKLNFLLTHDIKKDDSIYFYYNGHGIPNPNENGEPYLLPSDKNPDYISADSYFKLKNIYKKLADSKASKVVAFIDSCFSGATDGKSLFKGVAATRLRAKDISFDKEKMVVITAGEKNQFSNMYNDKGQRLFSYYVMTSLIKGRDSVQDLYMDVRLKVKDASYEMGPLKKQVPTLSGNASFKL